MRRKSARKKTKKTKSAAIIKIVAPTPSVETVKVPEYRDRSGPNPLEGRFCLYYESFGRLMLSGHIIGSPEPAWYLIEVFDEKTGKPKYEELRNFRNMWSWTFYKTKKAMQAAIKKR